MKCRMNLVCAVAVLLLAACPVLGMIQLPFGPYPGYPIPGSPGYYPNPAYPPGFQYPPSYPNPYGPPNPLIAQPVPTPDPDDKRVKEQLIRVEAELWANAFPSVEKALTVLRPQERTLRRQELRRGGSAAEKTDKATLTLKNLSKSQQIKVVLTFFNGTGEIVKQEVPRFQASADFHMTMLAVNQEIQVPYNCANTWVVVEWTAGPGLNITVPFQTIADAKTETKGKK